jgi:hypothetical protein
MRTRLIVGVLLCIVGGVWFLQGIGVIKGSFMTGTALWTIIGAVCLALGLRMIVRAVRSSGQPAPPPD